MMEPCCCSWGGKVGSAVCVAAPRRLAWTMQRSMFGGRSRAVEVVPRVWQRESGVAGGWERRRRRRGGGRRDKWGVVEASWENVDAGSAGENALIKEKTVRLVECAMLAATAGLAYFLSNLLRVEAYLGCFFPLPVVISSMRWGPQAGRKTMSATAMLLLVLSGPLKALSYLLMHGFVGLAMGSLWRWKMNWGLSIAICAVVRGLGAVGFVMLSSLMLRENLIVLITVNAHASFSYILAALGVNMVPTMPMIYVVFGLLLLLNCGSFVFLLHVLYAIFLRRLGIKMSIAFPAWVEGAI